MQPSRPPISRNEEAVCDYTFVSPSFRLGPRLPGSVHPRGTALEAHTAELYHQTCCRLQEVMNAYSRFDARRRAISMRAGCAAHGMGRSRYRPSRDPLVARAGHRVALLSPERILR